MNKRSKERVKGGFYGVTIGDDISSVGYVVSTLEASIWSFLTTGSFEEAVLRAVNLGEDIDTTGAVCGGLAGCYYGPDNIPNEWIGILKRSTYIDELTAAFIRSIDENLIEEQQ